MNETNRSPSRAELAAISSGLFVCLAVLIFHVSYFSFMSDDSFIAFRYARNLSEGHGLVFNPGFERVEGYTSFLWVVLLAGIDRLGPAPHLIANWICAALGIGLWAMTLAFCWRRLKAPGAPWLILIPAAWLAFNRTYAVWSTGGLETKLYETLAVGAVFLAIAAVEEKSPRWWPMALAAALASLTRPDGLLIAACLFTVRAGLEWRERRMQIKPLAIGVAIFLLIVGGHFAFRMTYYGDWLPNTYYAKLDGQSWWDMGLIYFGAFGLEHFAIVWLPLAVLGAVGLAKENRGAIPLTIGAVVVPHALYVAYCGGDNFEYRPLDLYLPLIAVLIHAGARALCLQWKRPVIAAVWSTASVVLLLPIPVLSHVDFTETYRAGYPGGSIRLDGTAELISSGRHPGLFKIPGVASYLRLYNGAYAKLTEHFIALRQEEQKLHLATVISEGKMLGQMIEEGLLPGETHIATRCVGAIPYFSGLRTLDLLGLTDAVVAHQPMAPNAERRMAHGKEAAPDYVRSQGVDVTAITVNFLNDDPKMIDSYREVARKVRRQGSDIPIYISEPIYGNYRFVGIFSGTPEYMARHFGKLGLRAAWEDEPAP